MLIGIKTSFPFPIFNLPQETQARRLCHQHTASAVYFTGIPKDAVTPKVLIPAAVGDTFRRIIPGVAMSHHEKFIGPAGGLVIRRRRFGVGENSFEFRVLSSRGNWWKKTYHVDGRGLGFRRPASACRFIVPVFGFRDNFGEIQVREMLLKATHSFELGPASFPFGVFGL